MSWRCGGVWRMFFLGEWGGVGRCDGAWVGVVTPLMISMSFTGRLALGWFASAAVLMLSTAGPAGAFTPSLLKLSARPHSGASFDNFGWAVGCSEKWIVSTAPADDSVGGVALAGAVSVYSAVTGRFVRKIRPADLAAGDSFGRSLAVCGDLALISAPGQGDGVVYLCNLATGAVLRKFLSPTANGEFGRGVALSAEFAVIGAYNEDNANGAVYVYKLATSEAPLRIAAPAPATESNFGFQVAVQNDLVIASAFASDLAAADAGAVFVFSAAGTRLLSITDPQPSATHLFGTSLAVSGTEILVGASNHNGQVGRVNRFDLLTGVSKGTLVATDGQAGDIFGAAVAACGHLAIVGAPGDDDSGTDSGAAYLFDLSEGEQLRKIFLSAGRNGASLGTMVAIWGNQAVAGALYDDDVAENSGAAYLCRPVIGTAPLASVARSGDSASNTQDAEFATFGTAFLNDDGESLVQASLTGPGGKGASGVWNNLRFETSLDVLAWSRMSASRLPDPAFAGLKFALFGAPVMCNDTYGLTQVVLSGSGVTALNNRALFVNETLNNQTISVLRTGDSLGFGEVLNSLVDVVQAQEVDKLMVSIGKRLNVGGIDARNDSAVWVMDHSGSTAARFEEGGSAAGGGTYGQFFGRAASGVDTSGAFGAQYIPPMGEAPGPALFRGEFTGGTARFVTQGDQAANCPTDVVYSAFTAEAHQVLRTFFKATLTGPGVTSANNMGLWHDLGGLIARMGSEIESGLTVASIGRFWPVGADQVVFEVTYRNGGGVTAANNRALYLWDQGDALLRLMRTGGFTDPECGQATIAGILQVGVHPVSGEYAILASLKGSSAATNLGIWVGGTLEGNATSRAVLRKPSLVLRKGVTLLAPSGQTTMIRSIAMSGTTSAGGAGNIGKGQVVNKVGDVALIFEFTNKAREVMTLDR